MFFDEFNKKYLAGLFAIQSHCEKTSIYVCHWWFQCALLLDNKNDTSRRIVLVFRKKLVKAKYTYTSQKSLFAVCGDMFLLIYNTKAVLV